MPSFSSLASWPPSWSPSAAALGAGVDANDEVCAVAHAGALMCEIQQPEFGDKKTHGFRLAPHGISTVY